MENVTEEEDKQTIETIHRNYSMETIHNDLNSGVFLAGIFDRMLYCFSLHV